MPRVVARPGNRNLHVSISPWCSSRTAPEKGSQSVEGREGPAVSVEDETFSPCGDRGSLIDIRPSERGSRKLSCLAAISFLDDGRLLGHATAGMQGNLTLSAHVVMDRMECQQEEDWALLLLQVRRGRTCSADQTIQLLVEKSGGDAMIWQPPCDVGLLPLAGFASDLTDVPRARFQCQTLKVDDDAAHHVAKFHGITYACDAIVNLGILELEGLPDSFFA